MASRCCNDSGGDDKRKGATYDDIAYRSPSSRADPTPCRRLFPKQRGAPDNWCRTSSQGLNCREANRGWRDLRVSWTAGSNRRARREGRQRRPRSHPALLASQGGRVQQASRDRRAPKETKVLPGPASEPGPQGAAGESGPLGPQGEAGVSDFTAAIEFARESLVCVTVRRSGEWSSCLVGFYVDEAGTVFAPDDVSRGAEVISVAGTTHDGLLTGAAGPGREYLVRETIPDLAVLLVPGEGTATSTPVRIASSVKQGQPVTVFGYLDDPDDSPAQNFLVAFPGVVGATGRWASVDVLVLILNSQGRNNLKSAPVFDRDGSFVGIVESDRDRDPITYGFDFTGHQSFWGN